jgi:APA family basic amino acid/polyamine antiporter
LQRLLAATAVIGVAALNYRGVTRTALATRVLVTATVVALAIFVIAVAASGEFDLERLRFWAGTDASGVYGVVQAAGLLFFAFAGYARIATMGAEVVDPATTIPRAIPRALAGAVALYAVVGVCALGVTGASGLADSSAPLSAAANAADRAWVLPVIAAGAALASLGSLLALMAGVGRTALAMAQERDLPGWLNAVHPQFRVPHRAEVTLAIIVTALVLAIDLRHALGFSSFGVLFYYAIANAAAYTQGPQDRRWPRAVNVLGVVGCLGLASTLPVRSVLAGAAVIVIGLSGRRLLRRRGPTPRHEAGTADR